MAYKIINLNTNREVLKVIKEMAYTYKSDVSNYIIPYENTTALLTWLFNYCLPKYVLVEGEQIIRPKFFIKIGGDCDNICLYILAVLYYYRPDLIPLTSFVEATANGDNYDHLFLSVDGIWIDPVPPIKYLNERYPFKKIQFHPVNSL